MTATGILRELPRIIRMLPKRGTSKKKLLRQWEAAHPHRATELIRINVGCGNTPKPGYVGVDVRSDSAADYVVPAMNLNDVFNESSVWDVYSRHMLEHLDPDDARTCLRSWYYVLTPGGVLNVIVPDLEFHCRQLLGLSKSTFKDQAVHALAGLYGWRRQGWGGMAEDAHRWGYTCASLTRELELVGFADIGRITEGEDTAPWHLNIIARKPANRQ